ncbi:MAG: anthranilate phosphoribosyltransferase [Lentimonas sp.]|jgi:anthranilate phosphoribosyltransferase
MKSDDYTKIFQDILSSKLSEDQIIDFLLNLNQSGFTSEAFLGAINAFKPLCKVIDFNNKKILDVCGTGGDKLNTLNISTATALLLSSLEIPVAKHGNKAISSLSGSADVLSELGINISANDNEMKKSFAENNLCFMFAPLYHPAFKALAGIRAKIASQYQVPTIFNFLGPLLNPANAKFQLIGTSKKETMLPMLEALKRSGSEKVFIVHGMDGMDEVTISDNSLIAKLEDGKISNIEIINPEDFGIKKSALEEIKGGDAKYNAAQITKLFEGKNSSYQDIVVLNSAFALMVAGQVKNVQEGIYLAKHAINSGKAKNHLNKIITS